MLAKPVGPRRRVSNAVNRSLTTQSEIQQIVMLSDYLPNHILWRFNFFE